MTNKIILTFDIDWAPDFVIDDIAAQLLKHEVCATWFVTHDSPAVARLREHPEHFELGIHPNFLPGSSHGSTPETVLQHMISLVPDAVSTRSHSVVQSGPILNLLTEQTAIRLDASIFLPGMPNIQPVLHLGPSRQLVRVPFYWADDYASAAEDEHWQIGPHLDVPGIKVFMFHPIRVYLNSADDLAYTAIKALHRPLIELTEADLAPAVQTGAGAATMLDTAVTFLAANDGGCRLRDLL